MFGGTALESGEQQVTLGVRIGSAFAVLSRAQRAIRLEASFQHFPFHPQESPPCGGPIRCPPPAGSALQVIHGGVTMAVYGRSGLAFTVGTGVYAAIRSIHDGSYVRPGFSFGIDAPVGAAGYLEVGWHGLIAQQRTVGFVPFGFGVRF